MSADAFAEGMQAVVSAGAAVVGGCCGTGPEHIRALRAFVDSR
jgi:methionine synthase I (cobalamin-dependent)